jgi:hypothetical protein
VLVASHDLLEEDQFRQTSMQICIADEGLPREDDSSRNSTQPKKVSCTHLDLFWQAISKSRGDIFSEDARTLPI